MAHIVEFKNVGRERKSWTATLSEFTRPAMIAEIRKQKALLSRSLDFVQYSNGTGAIYSGNRRVGMYTVREVQEQEEVSPC